MLHLVFSLASVKILTDDFPTGRLGATDTLILLGEAVTAGLADGDDSAWLQEHCGQMMVCAVREDLATVNIQPKRLATGIREIDYAELVELTQKEQPIVSWS